MAAAAGLSVLALTDHDSVAGWGAAAQAAARLGVVLVPGAEVSSRSADISVHLLSYLHDPLAPGLAHELRLTREDRLTRAARMVERIAVDYELTWAEVLAQVPAGATVGRPHIADALVAGGRFPDRSAAFEQVLHTGSPYHLSHYAPEAEAAVRLVRQAGGVPVLAHPLAGRRGPTLSDEAIAALAAAGLAGLEADHRDHLPAEREHLRALAAELGLFVTGSSDYHGAGKENRIGEHLTAPEVFEQIVAQGSGTAVVRP